LRQARPVLPNHQFRCDLTYKLRLWSTKRVWCGSNVLWLRPAPNHHRNPSASRQRESKTVDRRHTGLRLGAHLGRGHRARIDAQEPGKRSNGRIKDRFFYPQRRQRRKSCAAKSTRSTQFGHGIILAGGTRSVRILSAHRCDKTCVLQSLPISSICRNARPPTHLYRAHGQGVR